MAKKLFKDRNKKSITVGNTFITIQPYKLGDVPGLEHRLSVYDNLYRRYIPIAFHYVEEERKLYLPDAINIKKLAKVYNGEENLSIEELKSDPKSSVQFNMTVTPRDNTQIKALDFLLGRGSYINNRFYPKLLLSLDTGMGKTFCAIAGISYMRTKAAIIVPDSALVERWIEEIYKITDMTEDDIYIIKGIDSIKKIGKKTKDKKIIIISHRTLTSLGKSHGWHTVQKLFKVMKIGVKVYDEAHKEFKNIMRIDLHSNTEKTIYLTATASRSQMKENYIYNMLFSNVPQLVCTNNSREDNHINTVIYQYDSNPSMLDKSLCKTIKGFSANSFMKYNMDMNKGGMAFFKAIEFFMNTVLTRDEGRILIMVGLIDMIYMLEGHLKQIYPEYADDIGIYCSKVSKDVKMDTLNNKRIIITTFKSLGTGADIKDLKYVCMAEPYSSTVTARQCSGRLRDKGWYFELVDIGFNDCLRQYNARSKTLIRKSNKYKIVKN